MAQRSSWLAIVSVFSLVAACGDDPCKAGRTRCLSADLIQTCVNDEDDEPHWLTHECSPDETCEEDALSSADGGGDGGAESVAACVGNCEQGASECVNTELARYCLDGRAWQLDACAIGESCVDGTCRIGGDAAVRACEPEARECASEDVEKICDVDGSAWVTNPCGPGERCLVDRCAPDPEASCDEASACLDNKTALRCLGEARGFELVECEGDTYCQFGRCRGPVCALGSVCAGINQVRACVDGVSFVDTQCAVNEVCEQDGDTASCAPRNCVPGVTVCGDPRDPTVDTTQFYTLCAPGASTASGVPEWVVGECADLLTCDPTFTATGNPCRQACTPGAQTCMADPNGIADGFAECQPDGTWGPVQRCNPANGGLLRCALEQTVDASALPVALCVDPVCAYVVTNQAGVGGTCEGGQLRSCGPDGTLDEAQACAVGVCRPTTLVQQADGRLPGACDESLDCEDGEERCIQDGFTPTPLFQGCADNTWSTTLGTCDDDVPCLDYTDSAGLSRKLCGGECVPGHRRCNGGDLETCNADGEWADAQTCSAGVCTALASNDAGCVLECVPNTLRCTGGLVSAPDGSTGYGMEASCSDEGLLETPSACAAGTTCRVAGSGAHVGCLECIGPDVDGGNVFGFTDSRCDPTDPDAVQGCAADNTWEASRTCTAGTSCVGPSTASCGTCLSETGVAVTCTQTNIDDEEVCGPCNVMSNPLAACTQTAIDTATASAASCTSEFGGTTTAWGGEPDCCNGSAGAFLQTAATTCGSLGYGFAGAWAGEPDCCSLYQLAAGGPDFAYCAP